MSPKNISIPYNRISDFCRQWQITEFALFGSALRDDYSTGSDIDVLVTFAPEATWTLLDHVDMQDQLEEIFRRPVDLVSRRGLEQSRNHLRRQAILNSAEVIFATA